MTIAHMMNVICVVKHFITKGIWKHIHKNIKGYLRVIVVQITRKTDQQLENSYDVFS